MLLLAGLDLTLSLPIMGATYRPFSWMSIAPADVATLYPVIQELSFEGGKPHMAVEVTPGLRYVLQRSTNIVDESAWGDTSAMTAMDPIIHMIDTNPVSRTVFYRVKQLLDGTP